LTVMKHKRDWTILLYSVADELPLRKAANHTLLDIDRASASGSGAVKTVAQLTLHANDSHPVRRYDFEEKTSPERRVDVENKLQYVACAVRTPLQELTDFLRWGQREYPAARYGVILQGHAWGADYSIPALNLVRAAKQKSEHTVCRLIFGSPRSKNHLNNKQLQNALAHASVNGKFALLGIDACLMSMTEISYELHRCADFTVAQEGLDPIAGWPLYPILTELNRRPSMGAEELGSTVLAKFTAKYRHWGGDMKITQALCSLRFSDALMRMVKELVWYLRLGLRDPPVRSAIVHARLASAHFRMANYVDFCHFCQLLTHEPAIAPDSSLSKAAAMVEAILREKFIVQVTLKRGRADSFGLSIFFPKWQIGAKPRASKWQALPLHDPFEIPQTFARAVLKINAAYADDEFAGQSGWKEFLLEFIQARMVQHRKSSKQEAGRPVRLKKKTRKH